MYLVYRSIYFVQHWVSNSLFAEISNLTSVFIDLADSPAPDVSSEENLDDTETTSDNT